MFLQVLPSLLKPDTFACETFSPIRKSVAGKKMSGAFFVLAVCGFGTGDQFVGLLSMDCQVRLARRQVMSHRYLNDEKWMLQNVKFTHWHLT